MLLQAIHLMEHHCNGVGQIQRRICRIAVQAENSLAKTKLTVAQTPIFTPEHDGDRLALSGWIIAAAEQPGQGLIRSLQGDFSMIDPTAGGYGPAAVR